MRFPFTIYKRSLKATVLSIASGLISLALCLTPLAMIVLRAEITPELTVLLIICEILGVAVFRKTSEYTDKLAEEQICRDLGKECLRQR